jgi:hypothetical protein
MTDSLRNGERRSGDEDGGDAEEKGSCVQHRRGDGIKR